MLSVEQIRDERATTLNQGRHMLYAALAPALGNPAALDAVKEQLADIEFELARRTEETT